MSDTTDSGSQSAGGGAGTPAPDDSAGDPQGGAGTPAPDDSAEDPQAAAGTPAPDDSAEDPQGGAGTAAPDDGSEGSLGDTGAANAGAGVAGVGMAASMVPAYIQSLEPSLPLPPIIFPFNPGEYNVDTEGQWSGGVQPATSGPPPQWRGVKAKEVTVDMLLDAFSVPPFPPQVIILALHQLVQPSPATRLTRNAQAPHVMFGWGPNVVLTQAYVKKVAVKYERFLLGVPVRATVRITMVEIPPPNPIPSTNPTSGAITTRRTRTAVEGDTLQSIAFQEYDDPNRWRALAEVNKIDDPMRLKAGTVLAVPEWREAESLS